MSSIAKKKLPAELVKRAEALANRVKTLKSQGAGSRGRDGGVSAYDRETERMAGTTMSARGSVGGAGDHTRGQT